MEATLIFPNAVQFQCNGRRDYDFVNQRQLSLFAEGHRWVDMRRYGRLDQLPIDRPNDDVWSEFPRPVSEVGN